MRRPEPEPEPRTLARSAELENPPMKNLLHTNVLLIAALTVGVAAPLAPGFQQQQQQRKLATPIIVETTPIGSIVAWHADLAGTPSLPIGWEPCDGQMVADPDSPYFGQTLPDLNGGGRYLRGGVFSGVMQDDATAVNGMNGVTSNAGTHSHSMGSAGTHTHSRTNVGGIGGTRGFAAAGNQSGSTSTGSAGNHTHSINGAGDHAHWLSLAGDSETRPITMSVVWILRVK